MKKFITIFFILLFTQHVLAQKTDTLKKNTSIDSLMNAMGAGNHSEPVLGTFKASRLILSQTIETVKKNNLNFLIIHRFGDFSGTYGGGQSLGGLDAVADVYFDFEYGLNDHLNINFGRSTIGGLLDLGLKYTFIHQTTDDAIPLSMSAGGETGIRPYGSFNSFDGRLSTLFKIIAARKFSPGFSLLISSTFLRNNSPLPTINGNNEQQFLSVAAATRFKITKHMGFIIDYAHPFTNAKQTNTFTLYDPLGFGIEIETGGHVFTLNITNSRGINDINYLSNTTSDYGKGQYRIGFTISRMFDFNRSKTNY